MFHIRPFTFDPDIPPNGGGDAPNTPTAPGATSEGASPAASGASASGTSSGAAAPQNPEPWNGEVEHLAKRPWVEKIPEAERKSILDDLTAGVTSKTSNFNKGFEKLKAEVAEAAKARDAAIAERDATLADKKSVEESRALIERLLGEDDTTAAAVKEVQGLQESLKKLTAERDQSIAAIKSRDEELTVLRAERQEAWLKANYPDILEDFHPVSEEEYKAGKKPTGKLVEYAELVEFRGMDPKEAAEFIRFRHKGQERTVVVPPAVRMAAPGGGRAARATSDERFDDLDFDQAAAKLRARAPREAEEE